ncbi:MAG TPA: LacI family DNA-binding transcriptional regulator [Anaerolineales bacterium]|nr:LacI family DNA-binding transcriptional regulator [Anaerolineales bacterium]
MRPKNVRATIKEVASVAGVSTQTVSRVINERPDVSPETRRRVQEVIKALSYQPSALARSLISQRSHTLGVVTAGLRHIGPSRTLSGITSAAEDAGYSLLLKELPSYDTEDITPIFQAFLSRHVDGIIWAVPEVGENRKWVNNPPADIDIPLVYITMETRDNLTIVSFDNYLGGRMAMDHLLEQGCNRIGHVSGPLDWWEARQRMASWKDALTEAGLDASDHYWVEGNWSAASGALAIEKLFYQYPDMDAIFVANDQMALGVMQFFAEKKIGVPEDIAIVGFDNIPESAFFYPPLTTVQQDQHHVAKIAVAEVIKIIEADWQGSEPVQPQSIVLPPTLVVRQSSLRVTEGGELQGRFQ